MHIGVLGGGALGLTAALRLARRGAQVTIIEKESELGGLAAGFHVGDSGTYLEKFYHHIFRSDKDIQALIEEMGLGDKLTWHNVNTSTLFKGKLWKLSPVDLLLHYPISIIARLRLITGTAYLKATSNYRALNKSTAVEWLQKWMGKEAYDMQFKPVLVGKFGDFYDKISMSWFWSRVHERSLDLGYLGGGFQQLYNRLGEEIEKAGGTIKLETAVTRIVPIEGGKTRVEIDNGEPYVFDAVVSTLPTKLFLRLAEGLPEDYKQKYDWGDALGAHLVVLALKESLLDPVYWLSIADPGYPFLVVVDHTNMRSPQEYGGKHLLYIGNYLPMSHRYFKQPDEETLGEFMPHLKKLNPAFDESWIEQKWVFKAPFAQPIVTREYAAHIPPLKTPLPNVYMGNMFQVYPQDRGQNYSIRLGEKIAEMIELK
ncbi:MAG TPA: NAD(P)/FAD-dependent oxidoreductase [Chloroflexia bacterium]|nr:NAD(P)/FAD-dependent oxidoreductase [Chloroflexia bacterium]